jgi:hypothetical protein
MDERSSFVLVFGDSPVVRVIDFFLDNREFDYSLTEIAKGARVSWSTLNVLWPKFVKLKMVRKTRRIGRAVMYRLDAKNPLVQRLQELDAFISERYVAKEMRKQTVVA